MPSDFPRSPKLLKGALVVFETRVPVPTNLIVFQYNPDTMTRSFEQLGSASDPRRGAGDTQHVLPPIESFRVSIELDVTDQLEDPGSNPQAVAFGLHPTLAALELLLYPPSTSLILNRVLALAGSAVISPAEAPLVLLVWGPLRVVPVRVTSVSITEQAFDQLLNPIRAEVLLGLRALTISELQQVGAPFDTLGIVQHVAKEALARGNIFSSVQQIGGSVSF